MTLLSAVMFNRMDLESVIQSEVHSVSSVTSVTQSCLNIGDPMNSSLPGSSVHGTFQARVLEWVPLPLLGDLLSNPALNTAESRDSKMLTVLSVKHRGSNCFNRNGKSN